MPSVDYRSLGADILKDVGGPENIVSATHCATRLRLKLRDEGRVHTAVLEKRPGVIAVVRAGGMYQVVIGNNVPAAFAAFSALEGTADAGEDSGEKPNLINRFIELISAIFVPILWPLAATGLLKAFLGLFAQVGWIGDASTTYIILSAAADAMFYFLPIMLAVTSARRFKANQFTAMALAGALVYPSIVALASHEGPVTFLGLPVVMMSYTSSVIPIILAVWLQSHFEKLLNRVLPSFIRNFTTPLIVILIGVPFVLLTIGPATTYLSTWISTGVNAIFGFAPWLAGAILGGFWQVLVIFGLHWGFIPIMANDLATQGYSLLTGPILPAVVAQAAAMLAVFFRTRSAARRQVAGAATISGFLAGITEPGIYGVNLPLKKPFYFGVAGGAVGGAIAALGGSAANSFVLPSLLVLPAYTTIGSFTALLIGIGVAVVIAFALTWFFGPREQDDALTAADEVAADSEAAITPAAPVAAAGPVVITAPVAGRLVALDTVDDKVFSSQAMGKGVGIIPSDGNVVSPVTGTVVMAADTGHAYGITTDDGVEILVHIGINTVELEGKHFTRAVGRGDHVDAGDPLGIVDLDAIVAAGYDPTTIVVVINTQQIGEVLPVAPSTIAVGETAIVISGANV